jgi:hypothetical protein
LVSHPFGSEPACTRAYVQALSPLTRTHAHRTADKTQQIRDRAYQIWQQQGEPEGPHNDHWLQAEQELSESVTDGAKEKESSQAGCLTGGTPVQFCSCPLAPIS